jgi:hypothetical protein
MPIVNFSILSHILGKPKNQTLGFLIQIGVVLLVTTTYGATFGVIIIGTIANVPCSLTNY